MTSRSLSAVAIAFAASASAATSPDSTVVDSLSSVPRYTLPPTVVRGLNEPPGAGRTPIATEEIERHAAPIPDPIRFIKVLPGITSGNDYSSTYNANGGSYAENSISLNGVEIEPPFLLRIALGEAPSPVNPDMVGSMDLLQGVLPPKSADRLSSIVNVEYLEPDSIAVGRVAISTLRQALTIGRPLGGGSSFMAGFRRVDLGRTMDGLQTSGDFAPAYWDLQGSALFEMAGGSRMKVFGALLSSQFALSPKSQTIRYNCRRSGCEEFRSSAQGAEEFDHETKLLSVAYRWPLQQLSMSLDGNVLRRSERERTDVTLTAPGILISKEMADTQVEVTRTELSSRLAGDQWEVGGEIRHTEYSGRVVRFERLDWSEHSVVPVNDSLDPGVSFEDLALFSERMFALRNTVDMAAGLRIVHFGRTGEWLALPRVTVESEPSTDWHLWFAAGVHAQPPLFREILRGGDGTKSQKSLDGQVGFQRNAQSFYWRCEGFGRLQRDVISFRSQGLSLDYSGENDAKAFSYGLNTHIRGQLSRLVGVVSYSLLIARESLDGDDLGYLPRSTDQRHTISINVQDRMEVRMRGLNASRFHIRILYGSGFPHTPMGFAEGADGPTLVYGERNSRSGRGYFRFDVGMSQEITIGSLAFEVREEIANLYDQYNVLDYRYLPLPNGRLAELPETLGRRVYNLGVRAEF